MTCFSASASRLLVGSGRSLVALIFLCCSHQAVAQSAAYGAVIVRGTHQACAPPPVTLTAMTARGAGTSHILVEWTTQGETDNDYFELERSEDGLHFTPVGRVTGKSTTSEITDYNFFDYYPKPGTAHYRLRQFSFRGGEWLTEVIALRTDPHARRALPILPAIGTPTYAEALVAQGHTATKE